MTRGQSNHGLVHIHRESLAIRTGNSTAVGLKGTSGLNTACVQIACFVFRAVFLGKPLNMNRTVWHFSQVVFATGKNATEYNHGFLKHQRCGEHINNAKAWHKYKTATPIESQLDRQRACRLQTAQLERSERFNASSTIIDVAVTLARLRLPFRGHDETCDSTDRGVFREIIDLPRYDATLHIHIVKSSRNPKGYPSYLSAESQNDIIHCAASAIRERIITEVQNAQYFSVCMDTTPDESRTDQLSIIVRYVHTDGCPKEALLSLNAAPKGDGETLYNLLLTICHAITLISGKFVDKATMAVRL